MGWDELSFYHRKYMEFKSYFRQLTSKAAETFQFLYYFGSFNVSLLDAKVCKSVKLTLVSVSATPLSTSSSSASVRLSVSTTAVDHFLFF